MASIFGNLGLSDTDRVFQATQGQAVIYDEIVRFLARVNAELTAQMGIFVSGPTTNYSERYKLPGGGYMQEMGFAPQTKPASRKTSGGWDVAYPLSEFGDAVSGDRVSMAYMTVGDLDRHVQGVVVRNANTVRYQMLKALFNSTAGTFTDPLWGSLTVQRLANGDTVTYPAVIGSDTEATETHYLESGYAASGISDTNNPYVTVRDELEEHFGIFTGGSSVVVFINSAQVAKTEDLTDFVEVTDRFVQPGQNTATLLNLPANVILPGSSQIIGRTNGCWVVRWDRIPANYLFGLHLDSEAPLKMRIDPTDTGLGSGLQLIASEMDHPFESSYWSNRFGFGVSNRLNGVVLELGTGGSYTVPAAYQ